jgi:hypothetical protein
MNETTLTRFTYRGLGRIRVLFLQVGGTLCILFTLVLTGFVVVTGVNTSSSLGAIGCWGGWVLLIGLTVGLLLINQYPTIWLADDYLEISAFGVMRVRIRWEEVLHVQAVRWPPFGYILVQARRITPVHRLYSWLYSRTVQPGFIVGRDIEHRDVLLSEINRRVISAQRQG